MATKKKAPAKKTTPVKAPGQKTTPAKAPGKTPAKKPTKPATKPATKPQAKPAPAPRATPAKKPQAKPAPAPQARPAKKSQAKPAAAPQAKPAKKPQAKPAPAPQAKIAPVAKAPKLVKPKAAKASAPQAEKTSAPMGGVGAGKKAPAFSLADQSGKTVSSAELAGKPYVLYFYPKDNTPGCTVEACDFRDSVKAFDQSKVRVFGVSPDSSKSHAGFASKFELPFTLLADTDKSLVNAYGVWVKKQNYGREYMGVERSTFLVAADGTIAKEWRSVRVKGHVDQVLEAAQKL